MLQHIGNRPYHIEPGAVLTRWSVGTLLGLLCGATALIAWRRLAGAIVAPLPVAFLLLFVTTVAATAVAIRLAWFATMRRGHRCSPPGTEKRHYTSHAGLTLFLHAGVSAAVTVLGASLSIAGTPLSGLAAFWAVLAAEECWAWQRIVRQQRPSRRGVPVTVGPTGIDPPQPPAPRELAPQFGDDSPASDVLQQLTRSMAADGSGQLSGWLRVPFAAGQRTGSAHVAFCPPFAGTPEFAVEQLDGPESRIKTAQLLPYGARLDLKLESPADEPTNVLLQFSVRMVASASV
jgi:hypothetical protein